jgi:hypothetical protein
MFFPNRNFAASDGTRTPLVSAVVTKKKRAIAFEELFGSGLKTESESICLEIRAVL